MTAEEIIHKLELLPHPEGGFYKETYRATEQIQTRQGNARNVCTAIYFLLQKKDKSHLHRIQSDELWFFHAGQALEIFYIVDGSLKSAILGNDITHGESLFFKIPANTWFGCRVRGEKGYGLVSCTVAPGFDFKDFELAKQETLLQEYPDLRAFIEEFAL